MARPRKYSEELRRRAIDEVVERSRKIPDVARDLGTKSPETLRALAHSVHVTAHPCCTHRRVTHLNVGRVCIRERR
jgi:hypothetical protein